MRFEPGDVPRLAWDERPIRVLLSDDIEIMYEAFDMSLARVRSAIYYRTSVSSLQSGTELLEKSPLTDHERQKHRPDLPMRLLRDAEADWSNPLSGWPAIEAHLQIIAPRLTIIPFGPKGAALPGIKMDAANGTFFSGKELLKVAHGLQNASCPEVEGIGLYRSGISGAVPSYYIWGSLDKAGHAA